jgi:outer membrane immunogenic protein
VKKLLLASAAAFAIASSANAADMSVPYKAVPVAYPVSTWTGCYIGAQVGHGWSHMDLSDTSPGSATAILAPNGGDVTVANGGSLFGGQVGCDYQFYGSFVAGVQASAVGADMSNTVLEPFFGSTLYAKTDSITDVTARLGMTWGQALLYAKGGGAWVHNQYEVYGLTSTNDTASGWVVGGGIEWTFSPNWTAFVEYDHYDFGTKTVGFPAGSFSFAGSIGAGLVDIKQDIDTVKIGANYRFNLWR